MPRKLTDTFKFDLKYENGLLHPILKRVQQDHTLMMAIRKNYINIYYRGGNLLKLSVKSKSIYRAEFSDERYNLSGRTLPIRPATITQQKDADTWVNSFAQLKETMDLYLSKHNKPEREFQQLVARENNFSTISNLSDYFISDIEMADSDMGVRFDMLAIRWLETHRKQGENFRAALIEMKYGDNALGGTSGLLKHLQDIDALISDRNRYQSLLSMMETQFHQLDELELVKYNRKNETRVTISADDKPEVIFILANHCPSNKRLADVLNQPEIDIYDQSKHFDLKFFMASFAGYGLYSDCMLTLSQFREHLKFSLSQ